MNTPEQVLEWRMPMKGVYASRPLTGKTEAKLLADLLNQNPDGNMEGEHHTNEVARAVYALLGSQAKPRLQRKLKDWPRVAEEADDLCQLAAMAFIAAYKKGNVPLDKSTNKYTSESVAAYLWGICNKIFLNTVRRSMRRPTSQACGCNGIAADAVDGDFFEQLIGEMPLADDEVRLWEVLSIVKDCCRPRDIIVIWLHGCGFTVAEIRKMLGIGVNSINSAIKRVGEKIREIIGLAPSKGRRGRKRQKEPGGKSSLELLKSRSYVELLELMRLPAQRKKLLHAVILELQPGLTIDTGDNLRKRQMAVRVSGDWSWSLLSPEERKEFFIRDARLMQGGSGTTDGGNAQIEAIHRLKSELANIYKQLDISLEEGDLDWLLPLAEHLSPLLSVMSEFKEARERYGAILAAAQRIGSRRLELLARLGLSEALCRLGRIPEGILEADRAITLAKKVGDKRLTASSLKGLGNAARLQSDYVEAEKLYRASLKIRREIGDRIEVAALLHNLGIVCIGQGRNDDAEKLLKESLELRREFGNQNGIAGSLLNLGIVSYAKTRFFEAEKYWKESLLIWRKLGSFDGTAKSLHNLSLVTRDLNKYEKAEMLNKESLEIWRLLDDQYGISSSLNNMGVLAYIRESYGEAESRFRESLEKWNEIGNRKHITICLINMSYLHTKSRNYIQSNKVLSRALGMANEIGLPNIQIKALFASGVFFIGIASLCEGALLINSAKFRAHQRNYVADPWIQKEAESSMREAEKRLTTEELAEIKTRSESMSLEETIVFALNALEKFGDAQM